MFALSAKSVAGRVASSSRGARKAPLARPCRLAYRNVRASAEPETSSSTDESLQKLQAFTNEALTTVKTKWDATPDSEKPAAIAILLGVVVAQVAIKGTIDAVDHIPIFNKLLQLVGVLVTGVFSYRYFTDPSERDTVKKGVDGFLKSVTGDN